VARPGPAVSHAEGIHLVADLRHQVGKAFGYVSEITDLEQAAAQAASTQTVVVDRRGLVRSLIATVQSLTAPIWTDEDMSWLARQIASGQIGGLTGVLAYRVLGHYDPFHVGPAGQPGRIVLTAPNILRFERELDADPTDFHLWVALHEATHAVQFAAAPWLVGWMRGRFAALIDADAEPANPKRALAAVKKLPELFADQGSPLPAAQLLSPEQSRLLAQLAAAMSVLEGHADVIMDAVGPKIVKTLEQLRPRFEARRVARGRFERAVRRLAGIEAKTAQYVQGAAFVRAGLAALGHEGFNAVFEAPSNLPTAAEMDDPPAWIERIRGLDR
jgi:coenzyme F420 biosynthesis associated uncharacterized protein